MDHPASWTMRSTMTTYLTIIVACSGSATFGGAMFAFSAFVMHGLDRSPARSAVEAMQGINLSAPRPPLVLVMVGTTGRGGGRVSLCDLSGRGRRRSWLAWPGAQPTWPASLITGGFHIPRNNTLAASTRRPDAAAAWAAYSGSWQRGNHLRAAAALGGALLLVLSLADSA